MSVLASNEARAQVNSHLLRRDVVATCVIDAWRPGGPTGRHACRSLSDGRAACAGPPWSSTRRAARRRGEARARELWDIAYVAA